MVTEMICEAGNEKQIAFIVESWVYLTVVIAWPKNDRRLDLRDEKGVGEWLLATDSMASKLVNH